MKKSQDPQNAQSGQINNAQSDEFKKVMPLGRTNYIFMCAAGVLIIVGFLLMLGGSSTGDEFNPDIYSTRRIVMGPTVAIIGFIAMAIAIIYNRKNK